MIAQLSGECEAPTAWVVPLAGRDRTPVAPGASRESSFSSHALGWLADGRAVISFGPGSCGSTLPDGPGIYLFKPGGSLRQVYAFPHGPQHDAEAWLWTSPSGGR